MDGTAEARTTKKERSPSESGEYGIVGGGELETLQWALERAKAKAEADPSYDVRNVALAEKRIELFRQEHDNAGAFKFKRFGRETVDLFDLSKEGPKAVEADADGRFSVAPAARDRRMLFVNMGELARVNKEGGGHTAGNEALAETVRTIEALITRQSGGKSLKYTMLRYSGNEFMVSFESVSKHDIDAIESAIAETRPQVEGLEDAPPLAATTLDFTEAIDIMNQLQAELSPGERIDPRDPRAGAREFIEVMRRRAGWSLDAEKFVSRALRVQEKIAEAARAAGEAATPDEAAKARDGAQAFFDNYMKKTFEGSPLGELSAFEGLSESALEEIGFEQAGKEADLVSGRQELVRTIVAQRVAAIRSGNQRVPVMLPPPLTARASIAKIPRQTAGQIRVDDVRRLAERLESEKTADPMEREMAKLDAQIEIARRDAGTGLLERGVYYEDLEQAFKEGRETSLVFVDMGFLKYFDHKGGTDVGNDALKLAADIMERAVVSAGVKAKVYRYAGDEFTVSIEGGARETEAFQDALEALRSVAGAVPAGKRGEQDGYVPTELVFNAGTADSNIASDVFNTLVERGGAYPKDRLDDPDEVANIKAELMTMIADMGIEQRKAVGRFSLLIDAVRDPHRSPKQVRDLRDFSAKAIFAENGGKEFLDRMIATGKPSEALQEEISAWVKEKSLEARKKEGGRTELLSQLVEIHGKIAYYARALNESRAHTEEQRRKYERDHAELLKARAERQALIDVRKTLSA